MKLKDVLGQNAFWLVNKKLAKEVGIESALLLSDMITKQDYFDRKDQLIDGFFFNTSEDIFESTTLTYHKQKKCLKTLTNKMFIEVKLKGVPARLYFKVVENKILSFLNTGIEETLKLDIEKVENINKNKVIKINNNNSKELIFPFSSNNFKEKWKNWIAFKKEQFKFTFKSIDSEQIAVNKLMKDSEGKEAIAIEMIEQSIANGYKGLFALSNQSKSLIINQSNFNKEQSAANVAPAMKLNNNNKAQKEASKINDLNSLVQSITEEKKVS